LITPHNILDFAATSPTRGCAIKARDCWRNRQTSCVWRNFP